MTAASIVQEVFELELSDSDQNEVEESCNHGSRHDTIQNKLFGCKGELKIGENKANYSNNNNIENNENKNTLQTSVQAKKKKEKKESVISRTKEEKICINRKEEIIIDKNHQSSLLEETKETVKKEYETKNTESQKQTVNKKKSGTKNNKKQKQMDSKTTDGNKGFAISKTKEDKFCTSGIEKIVKDDNQLSTMLKENEETFKKEYETNNNVEVTLSLPKKAENIHVNSAYSVTDDDTTNPQDFKVLRVLGTGMFGKVFHVRKIGGKADGKIFAMKVMKKSKCFENKKDKEHTSAERHILESVKHPFIVELLFAFQTKEKLFLVQEYLAGGELFSRLKKEKILMEDEVCFYSAEIILVLEYLHSNGIIYRDLKPENILLDAKGHIKLIDFGLCKQNMFKDAITYTFCGTMEYIAPEVFARTGYGKASDWWSLGVLIYDMLTGYPPFSAKGKQKTIEKITKGKLLLKPYLTPNAGNLIRKLLQRDVSKRLGQQASEVKCHPFYRQMNWDDLYEQKIVPPFIPSIDGQDDTSRFDSEYLKKVPLNSVEDGISDDINRIFEGFSYVAPSMMEMEEPIMT